MTNPWFKFYGGEYLSDTKMLQLNACERSCWITLLCLASQSENGDIKFLSESQLLVMSGVTDQNIGMLNKFEELDMIRVCNGVVTVINWEKRQYSEGYSRVKNFRKRKSNTEDNDRREEKREEENRDSTPAQIAISFFEGKEPYKQLLTSFSEHNTPALIEKEFQKFILYWTEPTKSGKKQRWETQQTFEVKRRLVTWLGNVKQFNKVEINKGRGLA